MNKIVRPFGRRELLELLVLASHCRRHLLVQRIQAVDFPRSRTYAVRHASKWHRGNTAKALRMPPPHTVPSGLLHCVYTVHHAHILLVYSITPHSTPASHSTPLHTPPLYSLIHVDPRWARRCLHAIRCTTARGAGMLGSSVPSNVVRWCRVVMVVRFSSEAP